jgi:hypothetical protein
MYYEIDRAIKDKGLHGSYDVGDLLFDLRSIEQTNCGTDGNWMLANVIKRRKELLEKLGISLDLISTPPSAIEPG